VRYGFVTLPRDIGPALLVGIVIAGAMAALVPQDQLHKYFGGGILSILMLMAVGVPVYVCATASVPIAAGFMHLGASPGAALAFLIAGPATNAATLATIWKVLGRRTAVLYLGTVAVSAVVCGLLIDWLMPLAAAAMPQLGGHDHAGAGGGWPVHAWAIALLAVLAISYRAKDAHEREHVAGEEGTTGERLELRVVGMTCSHCAESVGRALAESDGVLSADVDLRTGRAVVVGNYLDRRKLVAAITELGYTVEEMPSGGSHTA
jgi:copper chaperone CopZ